MITLNTTLEDNFTVSVTGTITDNNWLNQSEHTYQIGWHCKTKQSIMSQWLRLFNSDFPWRTASWYTLQSLVVNPIK